jgi:glycosyltransferase involved in cell wall biosynthesis
VTRVLYVTADERRETFLRTEVAALRDLGDDVRVVSLRVLMTEPRAYASVARSGRSLPRLARARGTLPAKAWPKTALAGWLAGEVVRRVEAWGPEHVHGFWASGPATAAWLVADALGVPFSFSAHRGDVYANELLAPKLRDAAFARAISHRAASLLGGGRIEVVRIGVPVPADPPRPEGERFLAVGDLYPVKGHADLLRALEQVDAGLDVAGAGPLGDALRRRVAASPVLHERVRLLGRLPHDDVLALMCNARALVHPSVMRPNGVEEGVPVTVLEAGARRLPVIATLSGATGELIDEDVATVVPSPAALAGALRDHDPGAARARADALYERILASWDVRKTAAAMAALFARGE